MDPGLLVDPVFRNIGRCPAPHPEKCASQYKPSVAAANGSPPKAPTGHSPTTFAVFPHGDDRRRGWASPRSPGCSKTLNTHRGEAALVTLQWVPDQRLWSDMPRPAVVLVLLRDRNGCHWPAPVLPAKRPDRPGGLTSTLVESGGWLPGPRSGQPCAVAWPSRTWVASTATWVRLVIPSLVSTWDT